VVVTAAVANAGIAAHGALVGMSYEAAQQAYLAKVRAWGSAVLFQMTCASRSTSVYCCPRKRSYSFSMQLC
jgi:hypothetical protein